MRQISVYEQNGKSIIEKFISQTNDKVKRKLKRQLEYICDERNGFTEPYVKHFSIEKYRQFYELRVKASGTMVRIIFCENDSEIILLYAFYKRDRKDTEKALECALKIKNAITLENNVVKRQLVIVRLAAPREVLFFNAEIGGENEKQRIAGKAEVFLEQNKKTKYGGFLQ